MLTIGEILSGLNRILGRYGVKMILSFPAIYLKIQKLEREAGPEREAGLEREAGPERAGLMVLRRLGVKAREETVLNFRKILRVDKGEELKIGKNLGNLA